MARLLLVSLLFATIALPVLAAREPSARRGLRRALLTVFAFDAFYLFSARVLLPHLGL